MRSFIERAESLKSLDAFDVRTEGWRLYVRARSGTE